MAGTSLVRHLNGSTKPLTGRQALTVDNTSGGVALTIPTGGIAATLRLETAQIRWTLDGTAPTASVGTLMEVGEAMDLENQKELAGFKAFRTGGTSGTLQVEYFGADGFSS